MTSKQWIRVAEAARHSGMSVAWWRQRILRREIPFTKLGRAVLIDVAEVERMLRAGRVEVAAKTKGGQHE